ncbi:MAG: cytochrome c oxidase subunit [Actinomycetota bacterium]|nr:cytochrome c oxidase subunit [Actinomycetota bacterium]
MSISHRGKRWLYALVGLLALGLTACSGDEPQNVLAPVGKYALKEDRLWDLTFMFAAVIFVIVEGVLVFTLVKFRHRPGREAAQFHGNTKLEIILTLIPATILAGIAIPTVKTIFDVAEKPANALEVTVVGHQFWWEFRYTGLGPDGTDVVTANELHIPTGQEVYLTLEGKADDVNHSFWVPRLAGTQDVVPGRENHLLMRADTPDTYWGQCKEYCGLSHANMRQRVIAETPADFQTWLAEQQKPGVKPTGGVAAAGQKAFLANACVGCHTIGGTEAAAEVGPNLTHLASRKVFAGALLELNKENLIKWVSDAPSVKPGSRMPSGVKDLGLSPQDVQDIVTYLLTLK